MPSKTRSAASTPAGHRAGDVGVVLDLMPIADARRHLHLPDEAVERIRAVSGGEELKNLIYVTKLIWGGAAE